MGIERTLVIIKPDGVQRRLSGKIIDRILTRGLSIIALKMVSLSEKMVRAHYSDHRQKVFYPELVDFMTSGPVVLMIVEAKNAVEVIRQMFGPTDASLAMPGTVRGDFGTSTRYNIVHGSDSPASAQREMTLFFSDSEIVDFCMKDNDLIIALKDGGVL